MERTLFPTLLGNEAIKENLALDAAHNRCAHAYLIEGPQGSGKHTLARLIAAASVCENRFHPSHPLPCGVCPLCRRILNGISADVLVLNREEKATIGVDVIREMKESLYITPNDADKKFYFIEEAHLMTPQAQNSLLLSLEEPPPYVMFLLLTENASSLLETIRSRAPVIRMETFSPRRILELLPLILPAGDPAEKASPERKLAAAAASNGALGQAIGLLRQENEDGRREKAARLAKELTGKTKQSDFLAFLSSNLFGESRENVLAVLTLTQTAIRDMLAVKKVEGAGLLFYCSEDDLPDGIFRISTGQLIRLYHLLCAVSEDIAANGSIPTALFRLTTKKR